MYEGLCHSKLEYLAIVRRKECLIIKRRRSLSQSTFCSLSERFGNACLDFYPQPAECGAVVGGCYPAGLWRSNRETAKTMFCAQDLAKKRKKGGRGNQVLNLCKSLQIGS